MNVKKARIIVLGSLLVVPFAILLWLIVIIGSIAYFISPPVYGIFNNLVPISWSEFMTWIGKKDDEE